MIKGAFDRLIKNVFFLTLILIFWQILGVHLKNISLIASTPLNILAYFSENSAYVVLSFVYTFTASISGLIIGSLLAIIAAACAFHIKKVSKLIEPLALFSQIVPIIVFAPFFIMIFGIGIWSKIMMSAFICFFPIYIALLNGLSLIKPEIHRLLNLYNTNKVQRFRLILFRLSLPTFFAGLKIGAALAIVGTIVSEMSGSENGVGRNLLASTFRLQPELMMISIISSALIGYILYFSVCALERKFGAWYL